MERETGIEPATSSLGSWHSTAELLPLFGNTLQYLLNNIDSHLTDYRHLDDSANFDQCNSPLI